MPKLLLPIVAALAVGGSAAGASVYLLNRDESVEEAAVTQPTATASPAPAAGLTPTPEPTATSAPTAIATETAAPAPDDWKTYVDPGAQFTIRYPSTWFQSAGQAQFSSYDLSTLTSVRRPPESVTVEVFYRVAAGSETCGGTLSVDGKSGQDLGPPSGATPSILGGVPAWQIVRMKGDPAIAEEDLTRIDRISVIYEGYCFVITAYYTEQNPDVATFEQIVSTFRFTQ